MYVLKLTSMLLYIISARTTSSLPPNDGFTTDESQSDEEKVVSRLTDAVQTLEDLKYATNATFQTQCSKFCELNSQSSTCCEDIRAAALSVSHLSSTTSDTTSPGTTQSQLSTILTATTKYETEIHQMVLTAQKRECHLYWDNGRECPLSADLCQIETSFYAKYCHLKLLSSDISSFKLILQQMITASNLPVSTTESPVLSDDVIHDVTIQDQRDLYILASACATWTQSLRILKTINSS